MTRFFNSILILAATLSVIVSGCGKSAKSMGDSTTGSDSTKVDSIAEERLTAYPDTAYPSASRFKFVVDTMLPDLSGNIEDYTDIYAQTPGILTFRGNHNRTAPFEGKVTAEPDSVSIDWVFHTESDQRSTDYGTWGGGSGWTGQPLLLEWSDRQLEEIRSRGSEYITQHLSNREIAVGSLCGKVYFIDYLSGKASRKPYHVGNPIKGTISFDPSYRGNLYVGHGVPAEQPFGALIVNLYDHRRVETFGRDNKAWRGWNAYDPSPIAIDKFIFRIGENGTIYKLYRDGEEVKHHSTLRYKVDGISPGIESSLAISRNYGYICDNRGNVIAINLNTLQPVWHYDNHDDSDATIVVEEVNGVPYIYTGCEVDKQGKSGYSYFTKLNGLTGEEIWSSKIECRKIEIYAKERKDSTDTVASTKPIKVIEGGMFATPLLGKGDCKNMIFSNFSTLESDNYGQFIAFDRATGEERYRVKLKYYSWSSPVAFYNEKNEMYVVTGDTYGYIYIIRGRDGKILHTAKIGNNFESSPIVVGNSIVVGSRGQEIYKLTIQ